MFRSLASLLVIGCAVLSTPTAATTLTEEVTQSHRRHTPSSQHAERWNDPEVETQESQIESDTIQPESEASESSSESEPESESESGLESESESESVSKSDRIRQLESTRILELEFELIELIKKLSHTDHISSHTGTHKKRSSKKHHSKPSSTVVDTTLMTANIDSADEEQTQQNDKNWKKNDNDHHPRIGVVGGVYQAGINSPIIPLVSTNPTNGVVATFHPKTKTYTYFNPATAQTSLDPTFGGTVSAAATATVANPLASTVVNAAASPNKVAVMTVVMGIVGVTLSMTMMVL